MKISAYHKKNNDIVEWYNPCFQESFDKVYYSKIFSFIKEESYFMPNVEKGGTGFDIYKNLPDEVEKMFPDYSIYPGIDFAIGFITRGCIRNCPWCVVPKKEGNIHFNNHIEEIARPDSKKIIFLDNNILALDKGIAEMEKLCSLDYKVDFNQGLDARLVNKEVADILAKINWIRYIRFSCDTEAMLDKVIKAGELLRQSGYKKC